METYPDAACSPNPLDPPVMTATLPSRENMFLKSWSLTSASADMVADVCWSCLCNSNGEAGMGALDKCLEVCIRLMSDTRNANGRTYPELLYRRPSFWTVA